MKGEWRKEWLDVLNASEILRDSFNEGKEDWW